MSVDPSLFGDQDFVQVRVALIREVGLVEALILSRIYFRAREEYREAYEHDGHWWWRASSQALADDTGVTEKQARRALSALRDSGHIVTEQHRLNGQYDRTTSMRVNLSSTENAPTTEARTTQPLRADASAPEGESDPPLRANVPIPTRREEDSYGAEAPRTTQTIIGEWIDHCDRRPPSRVIGQLSREIKSLLDEGYDYEVVRLSVVDWHRRGLNPATLPSILNERINGSAREQRKTFGQMQDERTSALYAKYRREEEAHAQVGDTETRHVHQLDRGPRDQGGPGGGVARDHRRPGLQPDDGAGEEPLPF